MEADSTSSPTNPDLKLITMDVKVQIRTLHAVSPLISLSLAVQDVD